MARQKKDEKPTELAPITPFSGFREFDNLFEDFRRSFNEPMTPFHSLPSLLREDWDTGIRSPSVDLVDEGDHFNLVAELPGFSKDQIDVQVDQHRLILRAERKDEHEEKNKNYLHTERSYSAFQRSISLPEEVDTSKVKATMKNGILSLTLPKSQPKPTQKLRKVEVD